MNSFANFTTTSAPEESLNKVIDELYSSFAKIFGFTDFSIPLLNHLTKIAVPVHQPCAKKISLSAAWSCRDCEVDSTCVLCVDCFEKVRKSTKDIEYYLKQMLMDVVIVVIQMPGKSKVHVMIT